MTEMRRNMIEAVNHEVEVRLIGKDKPMHGKCTGYTKPIDNDPEEAVIDIKIDGFSCVYEVTEKEIEKIIIIE